VIIRSKCTDILKSWMEYFRPYIESSERDRRTVVESWLGARKSKIHGDHQSDDESADFLD